MATQLNVIDDFLSHRSSDANGGAYLRGWKKNKRVNIWLHQKKPIIALWRHGGIPRVFTRTDKDTDEQSVEVWGGEWVCHEDESVLRKQYRRRPDGERENPPKRCPICILNETVRRMIDDGALSWTDEVFKFEATDDKKTIVLHAGGMLNAFSGKLEDSEKRELRTAGINQREAWKENAQAKLHYLFCVVDNDNVENGVQKAVEAGLLGDKLREVIADTRESEGREEGDPFITPYAIQWEHRPDETDFKNRYHARRMARLVLTDEIAALISADPPDTSRDTRPFSASKMRTFLEEHALVKLPWDDIFAHAADAPEEDESEEKKPAPKAAAKPVGKKAPPPPKSSAKAIEDDDDDLVECDQCGKAMKADAPKCKHCGHVYVAEVVKPPPAAPRKRSDAAASKPVAKPAVPAATFDDDEDSDEIPF